LSAQALRACVDRWNQANMLGWGPTLVRVSVRRLDMREQAQLGVLGRERPRCAVSLAVFARRDPTTGCAGEVVMPGHPRYCVSAKTTNVCVINAFGAYGCSRIADGGSPLGSRNATTNARGVLRLDVPPTGTHEASPLAWQRYPHIDGFIEPWTAAGKLRRGLALSRGSGGARRYRGRCFRGSYYMHEKSALRCVSDAQLDPCLAPTRAWNHGGVVVACGAPGSTTFWRFMITRRS
jgi:hypothetical protein